MKKKERIDLKVRMVLDSLGAMFSLLGIAGIAGAAEGEGSLTVALVVFIIGLAEVVWSYER